MATESAITYHCSTSTTDTTFETKMTEEVKPMAQEPVSLIKEEVKPIELETVSLAKEGKEENSKAEELPSKVKPLSKSEGQAEDKKIKPPLVEVKPDDVSVVDILVEDKIDVEKDSVPHSHVNGDPTPVIDIVNSQPVAEPAIESVVKVEEQPAVESAEKMQEEKPKILDVPETLDEAVEKPKKQSDILPTNESEEIVVRDLENSKAVSKEVYQQELNVPEVKLEEKSEVANQSEKPESIEEIGKQQEPPLEVPATKESEAVVKDIEDSEASSKEVDQLELVVPKGEVKPKEQSEVAKQVEIVESVEASVKQQESSEVLPVKDLEAVSVKDTEQSAVFKDVDKPESVVPEAEVKREEQSTVIKEVEKSEFLEAEADGKPKLETEVSRDREIPKPESVVPVVEVKPDKESIVTKEVQKSEFLEAEADVKQEVESEVPKKVKSTEEKTELVALDVEVKPKGETEVAGQVEPKGTNDVETVMVEGILADKVKDTTTFKEEKTSKEEEPSAVLEEVVLAKQRAEADLKEAGGESSVPDVTVKVGVQDGEKETNNIIVVEALSKEEEVVIEKGGEEREEKTIKNESENVWKEMLNEELVEPINAEDIKEAVSNADITERLFNGEKTSKGIEPVVEIQKEESMKEETPALVETSKDRSIEEKLDEATTTVTELIEDSKDSGLEVKGEGAKTSEDKLQKENIEDIAKSDVQNSEPSTKDGDEAKTIQELPKEVPAKPAQKQSNTILSKVKHTLVKAKKAIIGKSPSSKTFSSDTKGDIKVK